MNTQGVEVEMITLYNNENKNGNVQLNMNTIFADKGKYIIGSIQ